MPRPTIVLVLLVLLSLLIPPAPAPAADAPSSRPIHIQADTLTYNKATQIYEGKGHVVVVQGPRRLEADEAVLNVATGQLTAIGGVHFNDGFHDIRGDRLDLNINTTKGVIFHGRLFVVDGNFTVDGRVMERLSETQYRIEDASFTTCGVEEGERTPWALKSGEAELDVEGYLYARNVRFCILDVPVFYMPAILFPAKRERATGFLFPQVGASSKQGLKVREAFYWAINPSHDATVAVDYRGKLGLGGDLEYRYFLSRTSEGRLWTRFFEDTQSNTSRLELQAKHVSKFTDDFQGRVDVNYLNDKNTFRVLSENVLQQVAVVQESQAFLTHRWDNQVLYGLTRYSQDLTSANEKTVQTLPQVGYSLSPARLGGFPLYAGLEGAFDNFYRQEGVEVRRVDVFPRLWAPLSAGQYFTFTPQAGFRETYYSRKLQTDQSTSREALYLASSADTRLVRRFPREGGGGIVHKIEPAATYEYLSPTRQDDIPVINDVDQFAKKNLLTYQLTNRLSTMVPEGDSMRYLEFGYLRLTQSQHLASSPTGKPFSDMRGELVLRTLTPVPATLDLDVFYNHADSAVSAVNTDLRVELTKRYFAVIGQRFTRAGAVPVKGDLFNSLSLNEALVQTQTTHFYIAEVGAALPFNLNFVARAYFDQEAGIFQEVNYGLYYVGASRCWGAGALVIQRPDQTEFAFMVTLGGVGSTQSPFSDLYRNLFQRLGVDIEKLR
ncbi:MAG TPA: LPS assembly protein LptD [Nitrospirales bacterium]|nr:LPS assembly protein LptD [Nitrospirales bacterium]